MESVDIDKTEQFLTEFMNDNIAAEIGGIDTIILPKQSDAKGEFVGVLMTEVDPENEELDAADLNYDIIIRLKKLNTNLFTFRNKVIAIFSSIAKDLETQSKMDPGNKAFGFERSDSIRFSMDDDFYDMIFSISITI